MDFSRLTDSEPRSSLKLTDEDTRFRHLSDLLDLWSSGVETVKQSMSTFANEKDRLRLAKLEAAVSLLTIHMQKLADYDAKRWDLQTEIDRIPATGWRTEK